jgi:hypothetical protein
MLINSGLAGGHYHGYTFSLSNCQGTPATSFQLTATPVGESFGRRTFCTDQSGAVRASTDGNAGACQATGAPVE